MCMSKIRAVGYIRVSDETQVEGYSLDAQRKEIMRYCVSNGYEFCGFYEDAGVSAYSDQSAKRPMFSRLLEDAEQGNFHVVIVHTIDRWARRSAVQIQALERLGKAKVGFVSIMENFDYTTDMGKFVLTILGAVSEFVSALIGMHVGKAQQERAESGLAVRPVPFGYKPQGPREPPEIEPMEAEAVKGVFERRERGESNGSTASWLNDRGLQTRTGRMFTEYTVRDMLTTRFYTGVVPYHDKEYPGKHDAIVSEGLFQEVQLRRRKHGRKNVRGGLTGALQGMTACGFCGNSIHSERNHLGDPRYRERHGWACPTNGRSTIAHRIDGQVGEILSCVKLAPKWRERIVKLTTTCDSELDLEALRNQRQRIAVAYGDGAYTEPDYRRRLAEIDTKIRSAVPVTLPSIEEAAELLDDFGAIWREATPEERRKLVAPLIERVYLDLNGKRIGGIRPRAGFGELLASAVEQTNDSICVLLHGDKFKSLQNVGMVETGEGRTPRPEDSLVRMYYRLSWQSALASKQPCQQELQRSIAD